MLRNFVIQQLFIYVCCRNAICIRAHVE